ncbi:MAG: hypothetical protein ABIR47_12565 [Candidatus Kapaibacterium sp.]
MPPPFLRKALRLASCLFLLALLIPVSRASAQIDSVPRKWYDTLKVTRPRYAYKTASERLALSAFVTVAIPAGIAVGLTSIVPPGISIIREDGAFRAGVLLSIGRGFGCDTAAMIFFPKFRVQAEGGVFFRRRNEPVLRASLLFDDPIVSVHPRQFFWFGVAGGGGISTDFSSIGPFAEGWIGVMNPMGIRFIPLFPMHHYGLRARAGYNTSTQAPWYELSLGVTSTFW